LQILAYYLAAPRTLFGNDRRELARGGQMAWTRAAAVAEVKERGVMDADIGGEEIALYWVDDVVYATHNVCTHAFARLSEGFLEGDCIECPIHQAMFNVKTGEVVAPPAYTAVKTYPCRIEGDDVLVDI
jgi:nitrite reductase/ring-hydroxylating ferredoxin subunit